MGWAKQALRRVRRTDEAPGLAGRRVRASYAAVLDGSRLWLALPASELGHESRNEVRVALHSPDGRLRDLPDDLPEDARTPRDGVLAFRVLVPEDARGPLDVVVRTSTDVLPVALDGDVRPPVTEPDRPVGLVLERAEDGRLRVRAEPQPPASVLLSASYADRRAGIRCTRPDGVGDAILLLSQEREVVATLPTTSEDGVLSTELRPSDCPLDAGPLLVALAHGDGFVHVVREHNLLPDPYEVMLPSLEDETGTIARFRFRKNGRLILKPVAAGPEDAP